MAAPFQPLLEGLLEAVWIVDARALTIVAVNDAAVRMLGRTPSEMVGEPVLALTSSPEDMFFWEDVARGQADRIRSHTRLLHADGHAVLVERRVGPLQLDGIGPAYLVALQDRSVQQKTEDELERLVAELRATLDSTADALLVCSPGGGIRAFNRRFAELWQVPKDLLLQRDDAAVQARLAGSVVDRDRYAARLREMAEAPLARFSDTLLLRNGQVIDRTTLPQLSRGRPIGRVYAYRDITADVAAQAGLRLAAAVFDASLDAILVADADQRVVAANPACERIVRVAPAELIGRPAQLLFQDPRDDGLFARIQAQWAARGHWEGEVWLRRGDRSACAVQLSWIVLRDGDGDTGGVTRSVAFLRDLTAQHADRARIEELAHRDLLTGLPNRALLAQRVGVGLGGNDAPAQGPPFAILFLDLDRFKAINDSLGHHVGDRVLIKVVERINLCLRQADTLCRLGGDEFVAYLHGADAAAAEMAARRILHEMAQPFTLDGMSFSINCSIGVSLYPQDGEALDELIRHADAAMYRVKERGRGHFRFYQPQMHVDVLGRVKLEHAMRQALAAGQFSLHYQPQVAIGSRHLVGAEALIRWQHPELGAVPPSDFIPLAEETGYIVAIGAWVLQEAVQQAAAWERQALPVSVSVNVSALQFRQPDFVEQVASAIRHCQLAPQLLELELTESILVKDADEVLERLDALAALGVRLSIDDFGTGYSSLGYLKKFPIHKLKIDQSFIRGLPDDESDRAIVSAIINVGHALGLHVIAEGVETEAQRELLCTLGCRMFQGFLCAPGLPAVRFAQKAGAMTLEPPAGYAPIR